MQLLLQLLTVRVNYCLPDSTPFCQYWEFLIFVGPFYAKSVTWQLEFTQC
jgi:hypothetical protein